MTRNVGKCSRYFRYKVIADDEHAVTIATAHADLAGERREWLHVVVSTIREGKVAESWALEQDLYLFDELVS